MTTFPDTSGMTTEQLSKVICEWFDDPLNKTSYAAVQRTVEKLTNYHAPHGFMLEDFNLLCGMVSDLLHKDRAEVRRDVLREAAGIYCKWCNMGIPLLPHQPDEDFWHKDDKHEVICQAREINLMIAADQGQSQGEQE